MKLVVGLGNPGPQYAHTRHNLGFMVVDQLTANLAATWRNEAKFQAHIADNKGLILAKPQTFMNLSGEAVQRLMQFYKIAPADVWVVCDDLDTPFGRLRLRSGGSDGGHQGLRSITQHIGPDFVRARIGISMNNRAVEPSESYVLKPFNPDERAQLSTVITAAVNVIAENLETTPTESTFELLPGQS